ncbi:hypothetical protein [Streptomyces sp. NBC_00045]|uniref:hypothetical protein n=2 Tax=Streptomyces TaxID=1883 RepID=UPI00324508A4
MQMVDQHRLDALEAFWTWAVAHTLRLSGVRIEELLELTHLSICQRIGSIDPTQSHRQPDRTPVNR